MVTVRQVTADVNMKILREASGIRPPETRATANAMNRAALKVKTRAAIATKAVLRAVENSRKAAGAKTTVRKIKMKAAMTAARIVRPAAISGKIMAVLKIKIRAAIIAAKAVLRAKAQAIAVAMNRGALKAKIIAVKAVRVAGLLHKIANAMNVDVLKAKAREIMADKAVQDPKVQAIAAVIFKAKMKIIAVKAARAVHLPRKIAAKAIGKIKATAVREVPPRFMAIRKTTNAVALVMKTISSKIKISVQNAARSRVSLNIRAATKAASKMTTMITPVHAATVNRNMLIRAGE